MLNFVQFQNRFRFKIVCIRKRTDFNQVFGWTWMRCYACEWLQDDRYKERENREPNQIEKKNYIPPFKMNLALIFCSLYFHYHRSSQIVSVCVCVRVWAKCMWQTFWTKQIRFIFCSLETHYYALELMRDWNEIPKW